MPESTPSVFKTVSWLLAILLIGVVALYGWHNDNQGKVLVAKDTEVAQSAQLLSDAERKLGESEEIAKTLRAEKQELVDKQDVAKQASQRLQSDMDAVAAQHAQTLAAEQQKASQANAELQGRLDSANQRIAALGAEIEQLEQTMADATAAHQSQMAEANATQETRLAEIQTAHEARILERERQLSEKINFYRTALEGSDPERATQLVGLELQVAEARRTIDEVRQAMLAMQSNEAAFNDQLASANQVIAQRDQALAEIGQTLRDARAELAQEQSSRTALQQEHEASVAKSSEAMAKLQQRFQTTQAIFEKAKTEATTAMQAVEKAHASKMDEAQGKISDLSGRLQVETAALAALRQKHKTMVSDLRGSLDATKQTLAGAEAELSATKEAAVQAQQTQEQQIAEVQSKLADLEQTLAQTTQKAAQDLAASRREGEEAMVYVRGIFTELSKLGGEYTDQGVLLSLAEEDLRFRISKAELPAGELPSLDRIAELLVEHPKLTARIEGHTDSKGRDETNLELSQNRADAVKQALVERGVGAERMVAEGIGAARPIADNASSAGRRKNRRVEVYVIEN